MVAITGVDKLVGSLDAALLRFRLTAALRNTLVATYKQLRGQAEVERLQGELSDAQERLEEYKNMLAGLEEEVAANIQEAVQDVALELAEKEITLQAHVDSLETQLEAANTLLQDTRMQLEKELASAHEVEGLEGQRSALETKLIEEVEAAQEKAKGEAQRADAAETDLKAASEAAFDAQLRAVADRQRADAAEAELKAAKEEGQTDKAQIQALQGEVVSGHATIDSLRNDATTFAASTFAASAFGASTFGATQPELSQRLAPVQEEFQLQVGRELDACQEEVEGFRAYRAGAPAAPDVTEIFLPRDTRPQVDRSQEHSDEYESGPI